MLELLNGLLCLLIACVLAWVVLHPGINDGIVIKLGLIEMGIGFLGLAALLIPGPQWDSAIYMARAVLLVNLGIATVVVGWWIRSKRAAVPLKRSTDFADLDDDTLPRVSGGRRS